MKNSIIILSLIFTSFIFNYFNAQTPAIIDVTVLDFSGKPYNGDKVYFVGKNRGKSLFGITNFKGQFKISLPQGDIYDIRIRSIGDELEYNTIEIPELDEGEFFDTMQLTITYETPRSYTLNKLQFEVGKATLKSESYVLLSDLIEIMQLKPDMKIEVSGHTDSVGDDGSNLVLSQERANSVKSYLISKGINGNRINAVGYGEARPVAENTSLANKAKNRRTEIRIL